MAYIAYSLTNLEENKDLEICEVHISSVDEGTECFQLYPNLGYQFMKIKLVQNPQNPEPCNSNT